jgi:hypothetical protein
MELTVISGAGDNTQKKSVALILLLWTGGRPSVTAARFVLIRINKLALHL